MAEPLLWLPGMMCDGRLFAPQVARFGGTVVDLSRGESIEALAGDVLAAAPDRFALAGLSMGGMVAMEMLAQAPERVARVALLDTNPLVETAEASAAREAHCVRVAAGALTAVMRQDRGPSYLAEAERVDILDTVVAMAEALEAPEAVNGALADWLGR